MEAMLKGRGIAARRAPGRADTLGRACGRGGAAVAAVGPSKRRKPRKGCGTDLLVVPGIGPVTEKLLVERDIRSVTTLTEVYCERLKGREDAMLQYLTEDVGVRNGMHAQAITSWLNERVDRASDEALLAASDNRVSICVEGNISAGKTTFLQKIIESSDRTRDRVAVVPEPVDQWTHIQRPEAEAAPGSEVFNVLDKFYAEPERYAYTFQHWVFFTRFMQQSQKELRSNLRLFERSVFSDRMVFADLTYENKNMNDMEMAMYLQFFDPFINMWPNLVPDGFIYLRAEPSTCFRRMNVRNRAEEGSVPMEYLESLHDKHENWLGKDVNKAPQLIVPGHPDSSQVLKRASDLIVPGQPGAELSPQPMTPAMSDAIMEAPEVIRDDVVFLGSSAHRAIQRVPALVLDVNEDIDLNNDLLAKDAYATKVGTFFEYLQGIKKNEHKLVQTDKQLQALDSIEELSHSLPRSLRAELRSLVSEQRDSVAAARESGILL